eukprot:Clim_evm41s199 gene=Clim_evmTU41s199
MSPSPSTLVKYDTPSLVSKPIGTSPRKHVKAKDTLGKHSKLPHQTEEVLKSILPRREFNESGKVWHQRVSSTPDTRLDVINLQEQLDMKLQQRQARETGICPVRRELYSMCFDDLIRQVTINCAERGLLLVSVRDEIRMTIAAYQTLYESSIAFGMRKALQAEPSKLELEKKINDLKTEQRQAEEKKHAEEISFLKRTLSPAQVEARVYHAAEKANALHVVILDSINY